MVPQGQDASLGGIMHPIVLRCQVLKCELRTEKLKCHFSLKAERNVYEKVIYFIIREYTSFAN
jgi:hypothetical protein